MQEYNLTARQHAFASLLVLLGGMILIFAILITPALNSRARFNNEMEDLRFQYSKLMGVIGQEESLRQEIDFLKTTPLDPNLFLEEKAPALASADLQRHIDTLVTQSGGQIISTSIGNEGTQTTIFPKVTVKVEMQGTIESIQKLLYDIYSGSPKLFLTNFEVQTEGASRRRRSRDQATDILEVHFDVVGYVYQSE